MPGIQEVLYKTWLVTYPNEEIGITVEDIEERFRNRHSDDAFEKRLADISDNPESRLFIVAKDGDDVVGVCKGEKADGYNELQAIYVLPDHQGRGIGKELWNRVALFLGSERDIVVHVATYNNQAIGFYGRLGFVNTGKHFMKEAHRMPVSGVPLPETEMILKGK